jgi:hypothetical protein
MSPKSGGRIAQIAPRLAIVAAGVRQGSATARFILAAEAVVPVLSIFSEDYMVSAVGIEPMTL